MNRTKYAFRFLVPALALAALLAGCGDGSRNGGLTACLYAVDSKSGKLFELDTTAKLAASTPLVTVGQNSSGELAFQGNRGFVAVGNDGLANVPGLYAFDSTNPSAGTSLVGTSISAQYICIVSPTVGYVTSSDYSATYADGLYSFNPSDPGAGLALVIGISSPQDVVLGPDSRIYVAENGSGKVARINPAAAAGSRLEAEVSCSTAGATGLLAGSNGATPGVFVVSTGYWNSTSYAYENGSIEFVPVSAPDGSSASTLFSSVSFTASRIAAFSASKLAATGYGVSYVVDLAVPAATKVLSGSTSFGSFDVNIVGGQAYVPDGGTKVYSFGADGVVTSVIAVGSSGDMITNIGIPAN